MRLLDRIFKGHAPALGGLELLKYIGPGLIVTVGFIDPGNWASNVAAGSQYGYALLWMVTLSTLMLIVLQHNAAHLGIATGLCLSESATKHFPHLAGRAFLGTAMLAAIATALAEVLGAAIGLNMLFKIPLSVGAVLTTAAVAAVTFTNGYRRLERYIIGFVSLVGLAFVYELALVSPDWGAAARGWVVPAFPAGSLPVIMSVLGAVVMPHNIFLHSEIIQSRQWNLESGETIARQLRYEFLDTLLAMGVGWAINSAMIIVAAAVFFARGAAVTELPQAQATLGPMLGGAAATVFAVALLLAGFSSSVTASMAAGSIFAGMHGEPLDLRDNHSRTGALIALGGAVALVFVLGDPFKGLIWSQVALSLQLPFTIVGLVALTSSKKVMGAHANSPRDRAALWLTGLAVTGLNAALLWQLATGQG